MLCAKCGQQINDGAELCTHCAHPTPPEKAARGLRFFSKDLPTWLQPTLSNPVMTKVLILLLVSVLIGGLVRIIFGVWALPLQLLIIAACFFLYRTFLQIEVSRDAIFISRKIRVAKKPAERRFIEAEYGVPHCKFEKTDEGFKASFRAPALVGHEMMAQGGATAGSNSKSIFGVALGLGTVMAGGAVMAASALRPTEIEVTRDAVIIDGKALRRRDFVGFNINKTWKADNQPDTLAVLGYNYGNRGFAFGGALMEAQAREVASALNDHLRSSPQEGDEQQPSADELRSARPTDF